MSYEQSSMIYTMGMALNRAMENNSEVDVLVNGEWITGSVIISDGYGVVLEGADQHAIVKLDQIAAVRIATRVPTLHKITAGEDQVAGSFSEPMPMPGPRMAHSG